MTDDTSSGGTLERVMRVIEGLVDAGQPVGPRALARQTELDRSTVGRILQQLAAIGVLAKNDGGYVPGPRLFSLTRVLTASDSFLAAANSVLADLVEQFDETCYVCVLHGDAAVFLLECQSSKPLRYVVELGKPVPLHAGAAGRAILAGLDDVDARAILGPGHRTALTPATITDPATLVAMAAIDRENGYSASFGERVEGGVAIAAPFFDATGACQGSVVFTSPVSRIDQAGIPAIGAAVAAAAMTLSARLRAGTAAPR